MDKFDEKAWEVCERVTRDHPGWGWYDMTGAFAQALRDVDRSAREECAVIVLDSPTVQFAANQIRATKDVK